MDKTSLPLLFGMLAGVLSQLTEGPFHYIWLILAIVGVLFWLLTELGYWLAERREKNSPPYALQLNMAFDSPEARNKFQEDVYVLLQENRRDEDPTNGLTPEQLQGLDNLASNQRGAGEFSDDEPHFTDEEELRNPEDATNLPEGAMMAHSRLRNQEGHSKPLTLAEHDVRALPKPISEDDIRVGDMFKDNDPRINRVFRVEALLGDRVLAHTLSNGRHTKPLKRRLVRPQGHGYIYLGRGK